ncbi:hypothetical protein TYRP_014915 [Tyrophagus putrescentiae]|nr:hypothetical protein TYRP_014915 [Tyrophagus putrescentiae]
MWPLLQPSASIPGTIDHRGGAHRSGHHYLRSVAVLVGRELADQYKRPSSRVFDNTASYSIR